MDKVSLARKPWCVREDGDVWGTLHALVQQRSAGATKCTKVKGHATVQMVHDGQVRAQDTRGNSKADAAVHCGFLSYSISRRALAELNEARARSFSMMVVAIQRLMLAVLAKTRSRRAEMLGGLLRGTRGARRLTRVQRLFVPRCGDGRVIREAAPPPTLLGRSGSRGACWIATILAYLESLQRVEREYGAAEAGVSWLERCPLVAWFVAPTGYCWMWSGLCGASRRPRIDGDVPA